ncbi:MAG TPA: CAP domain-containing protein [Chloroflexia bacterium]|nr:CAP domain-containing protein [Chloroflexia bacterium]
MQKAHRRTLAIYVLALVFAMALISPAVSPARRAAAAPPASPAGNSTANLNFPATGHSIKSGSFINFFQRYGGVPTFGYPLAEETWEEGRLVQYFERQRFEYHPENAGTPYEVLLGRLGAEAARGKAFGTVAPFGNATNRVYVPNTQHALAQPFLGYWQAHGSVTILGYPISEVVTEGGLQVQYFERARMERHPENVGSPYEVLLTQLGKVSLQQHSASTSVPAAAPQVNALEDRLLRQINAARAQAGLGAVTLDAQLIALARDRSADMANRGYFDHRTPDGKTFLDLMKSRAIPYYMAGEIIAENNYPADQTPDQAYTGFMNSGEHHTIIMMGNWTHAGVGQAVDGKGMYFYTVLFSQPSK